MTWFRWDSIYEIGQNVCKGVPHYLCVHKRGGRLSFYYGSDHIALKQAHFRATAVLGQIWKETLLGLQILSCKPPTAPCHSKNVEGYSIIIPGVCKHAGVWTGILSLSLHKTYTWTTFSGGRVYGYSWASWISKAVN